MIGLQISIVNVIGQSNQNGGSIPPTPSFDIISEQGEGVITEVGDLQMVVESAVVYILSESGDFIITEKNKKLITEF